jgi:hypothetical protein
MKNAAAQLKVGLELFEVSGREDFEGAFASMAKKHIEAMVIQEVTLFISNTKAIADAATKQRLPAVGSNEFAEPGV